MNFLLNFFVWLCVFVKYKYSLIVKYFKSIIFSGNYDNGDDVVVLASSFDLV